MIGFVALFFAGLAALFFMAVPTAARQASPSRHRARAASASSKSVDDLLERHGKRPALAHALNLAGIATEPGRSFCGSCLGAPW